MLQSGNRSLRAEGADECNQDLDIAGEGGSSVGLSSHRHLSGGRTASSSISRTNRPSIESFVHDHV